MKRIFISIVFIFSLTNQILQAQTALNIGSTFPSTQAYTFGNGEQLSGQQFQTDGIISYQGYQYTVYYNISRNVCIARRQLPAGRWQEVVLNYQNRVDDAHNVIAMGICPNDGTIHLAYDHHNDSLHYSVSIENLANQPDKVPWKTASFSATSSVLDAPVPDVTYPRFITKPDGNLLFECRFHYSGYGDSYLREYDGKTKKWTLIGRYVQGMDVTPDACAYINGITYDNFDNLHISWCWRDNFGGGSNHDFYYTYSNDHGHTWLNTTNDTIAFTQAMLPEVNTQFGGCLSQNLKDKIMVEAIGFHRGYINQETQDVDSKGYLHVINSHIPDGGGTENNWQKARDKARLHHRFRNENGSWTKRLIISNGQSIHSTRRVHFAFDHFDNAYLVANGAGVFMAFAADNYENWTLISEIGKSGYLSEPLIDRPLLKNQGILSFVYLSANNKIEVFDYLTQNPNTPSGTGLKAEYCTDTNFSKQSKNTVFRNSGKDKIPTKTKSYRLSGSFETLLGEAYIITVKSKSEVNLIINGEPAKLLQSNGNEASYRYTPHASHVNSVIIESKSNKKIELFWSSTSTDKEKIPFHVLNLQ